MKSTSSIAAIEGYNCGKNIFLLGLLGQFGATTTQPSFTQRSTKHCLCDDAAAAGAKRTECLVNKAYNLGFPKLLSWSITTTTIYRVCGSFSYIVGWGYHLTYN